MKKLLATAFITSISLTTYADFIGVYGSIQTWEGEIDGAVAGQADFEAFTRLFEENPLIFQQVPSGRSGDTPPPVIPSFRDRGVQFQYHASAWLAFEHPLPYLPSIRLALTDISYSGDSESNAPTQFLIEAGPAAFSETGLPIFPFDTVVTRFDMEVIDISLYYEVLDGRFNLDLGLTFRQLKGDFNESVEEILNGPIMRPATTKTTPIDLAIPLLYAKTQFNLPFIDGLSLVTTTSALSAGGATMIDFDGEIVYTFDLGVFEIGASFGYRYANLEATDFQDLFADASIAGVHGGIIIHF